MGVLSPGEVVGFPVAAEVVLFVDICVVVVDDCSFVFADVSF